MSREEQQDKTFVISCAVRKHLHEVSQSFFFMDNDWKSGILLGVFTWMALTALESTWGFVWGGFLMFVSVLTYLTAMSVYFWLLTLGSFCLFCSWTCQCKSQMKLKASTSKVTETQIWFILWLELFLILLQPAAGELGLWWDTAGKHSVFYTDPLWLILWFPWKSIWSP